MLTLTLAAKLIGSAALFSSAAAWSAINKRRDSERLKRIDGQIRFVRFVRGRIDRYLSPIGEILRDCEGEIRECLLIGCENTDFCDIDGLRAVLRTGRYYSDGGAVIDSFLSSLGSSYRENEVAGCDICIKEMSEIYEKLSKELPRERKSRSVLGFCLAAAIVILLI